MSIHERLSINPGANNTTPLATKVYLDYNDGDKFQPYFCSRCRTMVIKYKGEVITEEPGIEHTVLPVLVQCRLCRRNYQFIAIVRYVDIRQNREDYFEYRIENYYK